jgi:propionyl-CoA synthetase
MQKEIVQKENYEQAYARWQSDPQAFWAEAANKLHWYTPWDKVLDDSRSPLYSWFEGAKTNTCYNCVDRHVLAGRGEQTAFIYDSPVTGTIETLSYQQLLEQVSNFAGALSKLGVNKGDTLVIYMPMIPQAAIAMLACARLGAIHSVVFGGFAADELAKRINDAEPKVILSASYGIEPGKQIDYKPLLDHAIELAEHKPEHCVIFQRQGTPCSMIEGRDLDWINIAETGEPHDCVAVAASDPLYILYTSGTTGTPKGVVRDNGGHMVALHWSMENIYGTRPGEVYWAASDVGWVVGHSYIVYAPLLNANTSVIYEGKPVGTPDAGAFWRVIEQHKVSTLFTAPTAFRVIKKEDPEGALLKDYDISSLRALFLAGERADPDTIIWAEKQLQRPVIDHWWQTETGWSIAANYLGLGLLPIKHGSPTKPAPGFELSIVDEQGKPLAAGQSGAIVIKLPLPPSCLSTLWKNDQRYIDSYLSEFPGFYASGDAGYIDEDGYLFVMSRLDDVINVAGHRLSTGGMEEVIASHNEIAECAAFGINDDVKGQIPIGLAVLKSGSRITQPELEAQVIALIREHIGAVASFKTLKIVKRLPKTRSGKILRATLRHIANGDDYLIPATIDDPGILEEIKTVLET